MKETEQQIVVPGGLEIKAQGGGGLARVDFRVTPEGKFYVLEINTLPGFTATSLVPQAAAKAGMSRSELCVRVLNMATC